MQSVSGADPKAVRYPRGLAIVYEYAGYRLRDLGKPDEALIELRRSVALSDRLMLAHPGDAPTVSQLIKDEEAIAKILLSRSDSAGALAHAARGLSVAQNNAKGPEPSLRLRYLGNAYYALASIDRALGKWRDAHDAAYQAMLAWDSGTVKLTPPQREQATALLAESSMHLPK